MPDMPGAEDSAMESWERSLVASALATLPVRQREALLLRHYAGLPESAGRGRHRHQRGGR